MKNFLGLILLISLATACDKEEYLKSESSIKSALKADWNMVRIPNDATNPAQQWIWNDNQIIISKFDQSGTITSSDTGTYTIHTSLSKAEIKIENLTSTEHATYNATWQIVKLDDKFLIMATDYPNNSGVLEKEFQKN